MTGTVWVITQVAITNIVPTTSFKNASVCSGPKLKLSPPKGLLFYIFRNFTAIPDKNLYDALLDLFVKMDTYLWLKEGIFKTTSKGVVLKKPIWIGKSINFVQWFDTQFCTIRISKSSPMTIYSSIPGQSIRVKLLILNFVEHKISFQTV